MTLKDSMHLHVCEFCMLVIVAELTNTVGFITITILYKSLFWLIPVLYSQ